MNHGYGYRSEQRHRKQNEDTFGAFDLGAVQLTVVCDGMGGHVGGAIASALGVRTIHDTLLETEESDRRNALRRAVEAANRTIYETARKNYRLTGMGTTCVAVLVEDGFAHVAHVGDSRAYLLRHGEVHQLTRDHTMVNLFVDAELLAPEDAASHPEAHVLSRSLGVERFVEVDLAAPILLQPGDRIILTSDGVHGVTGNASLAHLDFANPQDGADAAIAAVENAQGDDNATIVVYAHGYQGPSSPPTRPPNPDAVAEASAAANGEPVVRAIGVSANDAGLDDVAPIEDFEDLATPFEPTGGHGRTREDVVVAQAQSNRRAIVALAGLAVFGTLIAVGLFSGSGKEAKEPTRAARAAATPAEAPRPEPPVAASPKWDDVSPLVEPIDPTSEPKGDGSMLFESGRIPIAGMEVKPVTERPAEAGRSADGAKPADDKPADDKPAEGAAVEADAASAPAVAAWAPPPRCLDCTRSLARPSSLAYLPPEGGELVAGTFFDPSIPPAPTRQPVTPTKYAESAPRGPAQATAIRFARSKQCREAMDTVAQAMKKSLDNAVLYRTAWFCFNEADQTPLVEANVPTFAAFLELTPHFQGRLDPQKGIPTASLPKAPGARGDAKPAADAATAEKVPADDKAADAGKPTPAKADDYRWMWEVPAEGGIEYRLTSYVTDLELRGFQDVMVDMIGDATIADHLGVDVLLEATAAAAASRADDQSPALVDMWARRVYMSTMAMQSGLGEQIRRYRPDLAETIDTMIFEATGADAGAQAVASGKANVFVPSEVARAQAKALGLDLGKLQVDEAPPEEPSDAPQQVARATPARPTYRPRPAAPRPAPQQPAAVAQTPPSGPMQIKVYRLKRDENSSGRQ